MLRIPADLFAQNKQDYVSASESQHFLYHEAGILFVIGQCFFRDTFGVDLLDVSCFHINQKQAKP